MEKKNIVTMIVSGRILPYAFINLTGICENSNSNRINIAPKEATNIAMTSMNMIAMILFNGMCNTFVFLLIKSSPV